MLPRKYRVQKKDFPLIVKRGKVFSSPHLTLRVAKIQQEKQPPSPHFAVVVPKKTAGDAAVRNTIKRKGYESIRNILQQEPLPSLHYVFYTKKGIKNTNFSVLQKEVAVLLKQARTNT